MNSNLVSSAFLYYDKKNPYYFKKLFKKNMNINEESIKDETYVNKCYFYKKNKKVAHSDVHIIGILYEENIWIWGWSLVYKQVIKNKTYLIRNLLTYALNWSQDEYKSDFDIIIRSFLINSRFKIFNDMQLSIIMALTLYILHGDCIYSENIDGVVVYKLLKKTVFLKNN